MWGIVVIVFGNDAPSDIQRASVTGSVIAVDTLSAEVVAIDKIKSSFEFEGFAPGKSHVGTFEEWNAEILVDNGYIVGFNGEINPSSVKTDSERVDGHLKTADFFDVEKYPEITFMTSSFDTESSILTGTVTFRGISKEISFPVVVSDESISGEFVLDTKPFEMKYQKITNEVRIKFELVVA